MKQQAKHTNNLPENSEHYCLSIMANPIYLFLYTYTNIFIFKSNPKHNYTYIQILYSLGWNKLV